MLKRLILIISLHCCLAGTINKVKEIRCDCGIKNEGKRHLGVGENEHTEFAGNHAWPWMASIVNVSIPHEPVAYCGATLINNQYIMTAGHCIPDMQTSGLETFRIWIGTNYVTDDAEDYDEFLDLEISEIKSHPKFDFETAEYDVALIKLNEPVAFSKRVRPVCLKQQSEESLLGKIGVITGWGSLSLTTPTEEELKESDVLIVTNEECKKNYTTVDIPVTETMVCGSVMTLNGQDPCKGDSGGPLMLNVKSKYSQIGIISHGQGCSAPDFPTIFSRVSKFIEWIQQNTQDALYCRGTF